MHTTTTTTTTPQAWRHNLQKQSKSGIPLPTEEEDDGKDIREVVHRLRAQPAHHLWCPCGYMRR